MASPSNVDDEESDMGLELADRQSSTPEGPMSSIDNNYNGGAQSRDASIVADDDGSSAAITSYCQLCHKSFPSARMLHQHQQTMHMDKSFVCEICGKAFRFRSNLAEHRSVHTAVKPFVCKFCGKSSRLKGNLTKHILKHHKTEQIQSLGKDDIIIKKGKKSVKDPAAIDFLEKSMIVLHPAHNSSPSHAVADASSNGGGVCKRSSGAGALEADKHGFLLSLGLDEGSIDLKPPAPATKLVNSASDASELARASSGSNMDLVLEKCNSAMEQANSGQLPLDDSNGNGEEEDEEEEDEGEDASDGQQLPPSTTSIIESIAAGELDQNALAAACRMILFGELSGGTTGDTNSIEESVNNVIRGLSGAGDSASPNGSSGGESKLSRGQVGCGGGKWGKATAQPTNAPAAGKTRFAGSVHFTSSSNGSCPTGTKCPECGKHLRKARDLITHLATIHKMSPTSALSQQFLTTKGHHQSTSTPTTNGKAVSPPRQKTNASTTHYRSQHSSITSQHSSTSALLNPAVQSSIMESPTSSSHEIRQIRAMLEELNASLSNQSQVEQMLESVDERLNKLEKQLEMALNSIYTLVQLQSGINNQVTRFRDETSDQLKSLLATVSSFLSNSNTSPNNSNKC